MSFIVEIINWIISVISSLGYLGIFIGMTLESTLFPLPSELILPPAGVLVASGEMSFFLVLLCSTLGSLAGALINYVIGLYFGRGLINKLVGKYGRFLFVSKESLTKSEEYFKTKGSITTFTGRLIPGVRHLISIPAGFARMNLAKFTFYTVLGSGIWSAILIYLGMFYGNNQEKVESIINSGKYIIIFLVLLALVIYYFIKRKSNRNFLSVNK